MVWVNGRTQRKEPFIRDMVADDMSESARDANPVLAELIEDRRERLDKISEIPDIRTRAIAAMLYVGLKKTEIAALLHISRLTLWRQMGPKRADQLRGME